MYYGEFENREWRPLLHSFVFMLIRPTALILKPLIIPLKFARRSEARQAQH